jgi:hypothetical protein
MIANRLRVQSFLFLLGVACIAVNSAPQNLYAQDIQAQSIIHAPRIAPGETMPIQVRLSNFGTTARADVTITYTVLDKNKKEIVKDWESVAVETTATFIHSMTLPENITPGVYSVLVSVQYGGQKVPAVSQYDFTVEKKVLGIFYSDLLKYAIALLVSICTVGAAVWLYERTRKRTAFAPDYTHVSKTTRIYYEIIGDIIRQMRLHAGDRALTLANNVPGLSVDDNGKISAIDGDPATVVALLVSDYEKKFGKPVNLSFEHNARRHAIIK